LIVFTLLKAWPTYLQAIWTHGTSKITHEEERSTLNDGYEDVYAIFYGNEGSRRLLGASNENLFEEKMEF